jgi:hypothetical protein
MKKNYFLFTFLLLSFVSFAQNVTITKIIETDCGDPFVKSVELYVDGTVDFSTEVVLNFMQNGKAWSGIQIDVSGLGVISDQFVYIARDIALMQAEFPGTTFDASNTIITSSATNGDDGYQIVLNGAVVSQFGKTETDADDDTIWEHDDSIVSRKSGTVDTGAWDEAHWDYSGKNSIDNLTACKGGDGVEAFLASLGGTYPLGSGSGWTEALSTKAFSKAELSIYPNPVNNGLVTIKSPLAGVKNIALFDAIGRNVLKTELTSEALDVSELGAGLYLLKVTIGDRSATHKLIIN